MADSWARLLAASGDAVAVYADREPAADLCCVIHYLTTNGIALGLDAERLALFSTSGNVPTAPLVV